LNLIDDVNANAPDDCYFSSVSFRMPPQMFSPVVANATAVVTLHKLGFLETVQLLLISCRCSCCVKGLQGSLMSAREREKRWIVAPHRCGGGKGLVEGWEVGRGRLL
jgi:hypothetical protein